MKPKRPYGSCALLCAALLAIVSLCGAQEFGQRAAEHRGVPQDWSQRHVVFSRAGLAEHPDLIDREPRILHEIMQRWQVPNFGVFQGGATQFEPAPPPRDAIGVSPSPPDVFLQTCIRQNSPSIQALRRTAPTIMSCSVCRRSARPAAIRTSSRLTIFMSTRRERDFVPG